MLLHLLATVAIGSTRAASAPAPAVIEIAAAPSVPRPAVAGVYRRSPALVSSRPVYVAPPDALSQGQRFLYWDANRWIIGDELASPNGWAYVNSDASGPLGVAGTWHVSSPKGWVATAGLFLSEGAAAPAAAAAEPPPAGEFTVASSRLPELAGRYVERTLPLLLLLPLRRLQPAPHL